MLPRMNRSHEAMLCGKDINKCKVLKVGQYQLSAVIGKGSSAVVRLATHLPTGTKVAIKMLDKSTLTKSCLQQTLQEICILKKLDHPHIIKLYQVMQTTKLIYLVLEYASGGEIFDHIVSHGKMSEKEARQKFKQIVAGMTHCQKLNIVHRDLKAENLLLDKNLNVKIADFGFSVICRPDEKLNMCCGSPPYAAPELFKDNEYDGFMVDIWSLGILLYVMITGQLPFVGCNADVLKESIQKGDYKIPFFMSKECENLINRLLCHDVKKRITLMEVMENEWLSMDEEDGENEEFDALINKSLKTSCQSSPTINPQVLAIMHKMSFSKESVLTSLKEKRFDDNWATYHILLHKLNQESTSITNLNNQNLNNYFNFETKQDVPPKTSLQILTSNASFGKHFSQHDANTVEDSTNSEVTSRQLSLRRVTVNHASTLETLNETSISCGVSCKSTQKYIKKTDKISDFLKKLRNEVMNKNQDKNNDDVIEKPKTTLKIEHDLCVSSLKKKSFTKNLEAQISNCSHKHINKFLINKQLGNFENRGTSF